MVREKRSPSSPKLRAVSPPPPDPDTESALQTIAASELRDVQPVWLWEGRLRMGTVAIVQGDTGTGKSTFLRALAADVTGGPPLVGKRKRRKPLGSVLWFAGEEQLEVTVRRGLEAARADLTRVLCSDRWRGDGLSGLQLTRDWRPLEALIVASKAALVVIDPVFAFLDANTDLDGATGPARSFMGTLGGIADRRGALIVLTRNLVKDRSRGALASGRGCAELGNAARSVLHFAGLPGCPGEYALAVAKCNDAAPVPALRYALIVEGGPARFALRGEGDMTADDLAGGEEAALDRSQLGKAKDLLRHILKDGEVESRIVKVKADAEGITIRTLQMAAKALGILTRREGRREDTRTYWRLP